ncbi:UDP-N-acetylmuramoyl-L-alanyl-D-glutamate--2,6-diaminopimelate ligase [Chungangia koreensis]|uniref:UDP-N-acetylmuramoyl-L-alanyl-D-glutamate--2, 6-diaminopimelate ligase n=1 Tax=Chungangia koreensis TaxID=752657 RepID=A0ABV8X7Z7_9LACT
MNLLSLLKAIGIQPHPAHEQIEIKTLCTNSSTACEDSLFVAITGYEKDGHEFIDDAVRLGATAIIGEKEMVEERIPYYQVNNSRLALSALASEFYGNPTRGKIVIGVTGTNGKTTTSFMIRHILEQSGLKCALFGSVYTIVNGEITPAPANTTPDALEFNKQMEHSQDDVVIMEVSSHGIAQHRIAGLEFDMCLFTNLDQEHLDYHKTMDNYFNIKASLFNQLKEEGIAIILSSDTWGEKLVEHVRSLGRKVVRVDGVNPDYYIGKYEIQTASDSYLDLYRLKTGMFGRHNIENAGMAFAAVCELGISKEAAEEALSNFKNVPGRFELFDHPKQAVVVVDYAHTAGAFEHILQTAREMGAKRIFHVFGFRGNRDPEKREYMVEVSVKYSDRSILTFDDLNKVSPEAMEKVLTELNKYEETLVIPDRTIAVQTAWEQLQEGDWLIITGKGHELYKDRYVYAAESDIQLIQFLQNEENVSQRVSENNSYLSKNKLFLEKC